MSQKYASQQPAGYKNHIEKVAIVGAGGQLGKWIVEELLKTGKHTITAITRASSTNTMPSGVQVKKVDYDDPSTIATALEGQDALIITMDAFAPAEQELKLVEAAAAANVPWVLPNTWGTNQQHEGVNKDLRLGTKVKNTTSRIQELGKSSWLGVSCGFWYEFSLAGGLERYGFDLKQRKVLFFDDGSRKLTTSTFPFTALTVAKALSLKVLPEDENDKSTTLSDWRNDFIHVGSFNVSQQEMLESVLRVTGTKREDWEISNIPVQEWFKQGQQELASGIMPGFTKSLYSRMFFPDDSGNLVLHFGLDNEKLGLPEEDIDEFTKVAIQMANDDYMKKKYGF